MSLGESQEGVFWILSVCSAIGIKDEAVTSFNSVFRLLESTISMPQ